VVWRNLVIDFRYHVVSLTAVFLALAVGVVLGSGPLRTALVAELTNESSELKAALADSQAETDSVRRDAEIGEEFVAQAAEVLVGDVLADSHVAIVQILTPNGVEVASLKDRIVQAGGTITANLSIEPEWTDEAQATFRAAFATQIVENVVGVDSTVAPDRVLAHALAQALVPTEFSTGTTQTEGATATATATATAADRSRVLLDLLEGAELVSGTVTGEVDAVVFVIGPGPNTDEEMVAVSDIFTEIAGVTDEYVDGTVVATGSSRYGDVPSMIQASALLNDNVTTVTDGLNFYGQFTVVLGLAKEVGGTTGHYGFGEDLLLYPGQ
jgi:hypothetical protein